MLTRILKRLKKSTGWLRAWCMAFLWLPLQRILRRPITDVSIYQRRIPFIERHEYSQNGEDGIIHAIFAMIGTTNKYVVEFGVEDGVECNAHYLLKHKGWTGLLMDGQDHSPERGVQKEFITAENINDLFRKYGVPAEPDLLSIDIDGNDYWIWKAIEGYRPRVVIMEYNAHFPPPERKTIPYDPAFAWDKTDFYGASLGALVALANEKGYMLVGTDQCGVNAFFVRNDLLANSFDPPHWEALYHSPAFKGKKGNHHPHDQQNRPWVTV